jgi:predicted nucleotide-binding protein
MERIEILAKLREYRERLTGEVLHAYRTRGSSYGDERFDAWKMRLSTYLDSSLPGASSKLAAKLKHSAFYRSEGETDSQVFWREDGERSLSFIDSLLIDVENDEYHPGSLTDEPALDRVVSPGPEPSKKVFVVHGHDGEPKEAVARFLEGLRLQPVILHEQANQGRTIIEKFEQHADVGFAVVLLTPDDVGGVSGLVFSSQKPRARQNVVFELGYFIGRLGRSRVCALKLGDVEVPSDISGVVYVPYDAGGAWRTALGQELEEAGYEIDWNKVMRGRR